MVDAVAYLKEAEAELFEKKKTLYHLKKAQRKQELRQNVESQWKSVNKADPFGGFCRQGGDCTRTTERCPAVM